MKVAEFAKFIQDKVKEEMGEPARPTD